MEGSEGNGKLRGGIDLGGTKIEAIVADPDHNVVGQARHPTPAEGGPEAVAETMAKALQEAAEQGNVKSSDLLGVGVGSPGDVDENNGTVANARNLPDWLRAYPLADKLSKELGTQVRLGNDVQVATQAEFDLGAGKPYDSVLGVFWEGLGLPRLAT